MYIADMTDRNTPIQDLSKLPCFNLSLRKATRVMNKIYDGYLASCGLKTGQFSILRVIYVMGESTNKSLQSFLVLDQTTLTRNLKPLLRDGYLNATPGSDRRQKNLTLTEDGRRLYLEAEQLWLQAQGEIYQKLGHEMSYLLMDVSDEVVKLD